MATSSTTTNTVVIDLTASTDVRNCSFCALPNHNISSCNNLQRFENMLLNKWRENLTRPHVFIEWIRDNFEEKMVPYTRRIYTLNYQKTYRYDEFSCMNAICNRMNTLNLTSYIEANISRHDILEQERLLAELEEEQVAAAQQESFDLPAPRSQPSDKKRKLMLIYDKETFKQLSLENEDVSGKVQCSVCWGDFSKKCLVRLNCSHLFCTSCTDRLEDCAICRAPIVERFVCSKRALLDLQGKE